jgi:hypothetical protein
MSKQSEGSQDHREKPARAQTEKSSPAKVVGDHHTGQGIVRDKRGEDQPADKDRARHQPDGL